MTRAEEIFGLVERIEPILAHKEPLVQSWVLAELLSMWLGGFHILGDEEGTGRMRAELLANHCELVRELTVVNAGMVLGGPLERGGDEGWEH